MGEQTLFQSIFGNREFSSCKLLLEVSRVRLQISMYEIVHFKRYMLDFEKSVNQDQPVYSHSQTKMYPVKI